MPDAPLTIARRYLARAQITGDRKYADVALVAAILALIEELQRFREALAQLEGRVAPLATEH